MLKKLTYSLIFKIFPIIILLFVIVNAPFGIQKNKILNEGVPMVFAHRGVVIELAENSLESFEKAKKMGFMIELDVNQTKDNRLIIFHDKTGNRLLNTSEEISTISFSDLRNKYLYYNDKPTQNKVLSLEEYFTKFKDVITYLDIKVSNRKVADSIVFLIEKYDLYNQVIVADANILFLSYIKLKNQKITTALEGFNAGKQWTFSMIPNSIMPDYFAGFLSKTDDQFFNFLRKKGIENRFIAYGVNEQNFENKELLHIKHYITDFYPEILNEHK